MTPSILSPPDTGSETTYVEFNDRPLGGHRLLLEMLPIGGRILDVGCSGGYLAERLAARGSVVSGIELDPRAAERAGAHCDRVLVGDVETLELPFDPATFDAIACGDLIEHLRRPGDVLARLRGLLKPGGRLVLTTPNVANWTIRLQLLFGRFHYTDRGILDRTHAHLFTRRTLIACLVGAGYEVERLDFTVPVPIFGSPAVERLAHRIGALRPQLLAFQFVAAARAPRPAG
ncbi:MAG: methyltransferase domain-containing protein [Solirubrobacterales bacterium]|nr:methyltransferase domain-containing protein [Solirubrobacterales bacterium]